MDINAAAAAARHCHGFVLVVGLFALVGKLLVDDRLRVGLCGNFDDGDDQVAVM